MPKTSDASSFTHFQKVAAQSVQTTKNPTQSSTPALSKIAPSVVAPIARASAVAVSSSPNNVVVVLPTVKVNTKKRG